MPGEYSEAGTIAFSEMDVGGLSEPGAVSGSRHQKSGN
jgi:hypothetical protein